MLRQSCKWNCAIAVHVGNVAAVLDKGKTDVNGLAAGVAIQLMQLMERRQLEILNLLILSSPPGCWG